MSLEQRKKVLIVENDLFFTSKITETVKRLGLEPLVVVKVVEIFKLLSQTEISLLIIDLSLDVIDTLSLVERLKSSAPTGEIPVIAFAEHTDKDLLQGARDAGCEMVVSNRNLVRNLKDLVEASLAS